MMMLTGIAAIGWHRTCGVTAVPKTVIEHMPTRLKAIGINDSTGVSIEVDTGRYVSSDLALKMQTAMQAIYEAS
ncbi:hypothetical protein JP75_02420 [Devosia riboflavina]|uniref:Uncharacterized protein n=1 Tax=Devosia riboflavina TaxID=46914 RepID=A0A087M6C7_9HYPH|nr:hypothetical protein [Devosia riboflavina]KFL32430.1 hypothetical protein JP75_02420 [Devosia riboflavina]